MTLLRDNKLYTANEMAMALAASAQFVHVDWDVAAWERELAFYYTGEGKAHIKNVALGGKFITDEMRRAHIQGHSPKLFYAEGVIDHVTERHGRFCSLCGAVDGLTHTNYFGQHWLGSSEGSKLDLFISPAATVLVGSLHGGTRTFCRDCARLAAHHKCKKRLDLRHEADCLAVVMHLYQNPFFRCRVKDNAANWQRVKFDPRRPLPIAA
jgi:hypothetical protein